MTTWNPADLQNVTLSNGNLTAANSTTAQCFVRGTGPGKTSGLVYWEITINVLTGNFESPGLANINFDINQNVPGFDSGANALGLILGGGAGVPIWVGGSHIGSVGGGGADAAVGDIIANAYKFSTNEYWGRIWRSSAWQNDWNATSGADPATGTGGVTLTGLNVGSPPGFYIVIGGQTVGDQVTMNPGPTGLLAGMPPSGFSTWDAGAAPTPKIFIGV